MEWVREAHKKQTKQTTKVMWPTPRQAGVGLTFTTERANPMLKFNHGLKSSFCLWNDVVGQVGPRGTRTRERSDRGCGSDSLNRPHTAGKQREKFNKWVLEQGLGQGFFGSSRICFLFLLWGKTWRRRKAISSGEESTASVPIQDWVWEQVSVVMDIKRGRRAVIPLDKQMGFFWSRLKEESEKGCLWTYS